MTGAPITQAMVLAAGRGERMRPITADLPKALVPAGGISLLDRALDALAAAGVETCVVNTHYLAERVSAHLARRRRPRIVLSPESTLLDTGGGVRQALTHFGDAPFYTVNADALWLDGPSPMLARLSRQWDPARMDALLLLHPTVAAHGYDSDAMGDYHLAPDGRARWRGRSGIASFVFAGVTVCDRRLYADAPDGAFSQLLLWNRAEERERLYGLRHDGVFFHVGTPAALAEADAYFAQGGGPRRTME
jgi:MurNAc alpha-1-phosphate uridylyltransferase